MCNKNKRIKLGLKAREAAKRLRRSFGKMCPESQAKKVFKGGNSAQPCQKLLIQVRRGTWIFLVGIIGELGKSTLA